MQIKANGIFLEMEERGPADGVPIIFIRGLGTQLVFWVDELLDGFAAHGYRVIVFDNRDVGKSQRFASPGRSDDAASILAAQARGKLPEPAYELDDMAADVIGLMDAIGISRANIFGISMGGGIAQLLAMHHADRCKSVTIVMSAVRFAAGGLLEKLLALPCSESEFEDAVVLAEREWGSPGFRWPEDDVRALAQRAYKRGYDAEGINRQALATAQSGDRSTQLKNVKVPCMVIHGTDDALIPPEAGAEIASLIPNAVFHQIDGMGHTITPKLAPLIVETVLPLLQNTD